MSRFSFFLALSLLTSACGGPLDQEVPEELASAMNELSTAIYVRITGTCFQTYEMLAVNTGTKLGAAALVFRPGEEGKQLAFCAGTDRIVLRGNKRSDGDFAVENVWIQQSGGAVGQNVEFVRALKLETGATFERALNATPVRAVSFQLGSHTLSDTSARQFANGRIIFAGARGSSGGGGYGQSSGSTNTRKVDAVFQEMQ